MMVAVEFSGYSLWSVYKRSEASKAIARTIIDQYKPTSAEDMQDALKDIFGPMLEVMLQGEMNSHMGYESNDRGYEDTNNRRNAYTHKTLKTTMGGVEIDDPRERDGFFDPQLITKRTKDTTNTIESINSSFCKVMKKDSFPSEDAVMEALYLRITELYKKWNGIFVANWILVRNQLSMDDKLQTRILKYENY